MIDRLDVSNRFHRVLRVLSVVFFFQAEDGIRDHCVTGVQTCALPICSVAGQVAKNKGCRVIGTAGGKEKCDWLVNEAHFDAAIDYKSEDIGARLSRSEERRVGEEGRSRWAPYHLKKKKKMQNRQHNSK